MSCGTGRLVGFPLMLLLVPAGMFGETPAAPGQNVVYRGMGATGDYVPADVAFVVLMCIHSIPAQLAGYRRRGVLKRYRVSSVQPRHRGS